MYLQLVDQLAVFCLHLRTKLVFHLDVFLLFQVGPLVEQNVGVGGIRDFSPPVTSLKAAETFPLYVFLLEGSHALVVEFEPAELLGPNKRVVVAAFRGAGVDYNSLEAVG